MHRIHISHGRPKVKIATALSEYDGAAVIFDLQGQYLPLTTERRRGYQLSVNPYEKTTDVPIQSVQYNPLLDVGLEDEKKALKMIHAIADACVVPVRDTYDHWYNLTIAFVQALISHLLTRYPKENHTLPFLYDLLLQSGLKQESELVRNMISNDSFGNSIQNVAEICFSAGKREIKSLETCLRHSLQWIDHPQMRSHLSGSDFSFSNFGLQTEKETLHITFPYSMLVNPSWLRVMASTGLTAMMIRKEKTKTPIVFMLGGLTDFKGQLDIIVSEFSAMPLWGINIWTYINSIEELKKDYPKRWNDMMSQSTTEFYRKKKRLWFF